MIANAYCALTGMIFGLAAGTALHNGIRPEVVLLVMVVIGGGIALWRRSRT